MSSAEHVSLRRALQDLIDFYEATLDHGSRSILPPPAMAFSLLAPGEFEDVFAAARGAHLQLKFARGYSGRIALLSRQPLIPWLAACAWSTEAARSGTKVTIACPYEPLGMAALLMTLTTRLTWRRLDCFRFDTTDWRTFVKGLREMAPWDIHLVHSPERGSSELALETGLRQGGVVVSHPDDRPILSPPMARTLLLQSVQAPWPPGRVPEPLLLSGGLVALGSDRVLGVGAFDPLDGLIIFDAGSYVQRPE